MKKKINKDMKFTSSSMIMCNVKFPVVWKNISVNIHYTLVMYLNDDKVLAMDKPEFTDMTDLQVDDSTLITKFSQIDEYFTMMKNLGCNYEQEICDKIEEFIKLSDPKIFINELSPMFLKPKSK